MTDFYIKQVVVAPSNITTVDTGILVSPDGGSKVIVNLDEPGVIRVEQAVTKIEVKDIGTTVVQVNPIALAEMKVAACVQGPPGASATSTNVTAAVAIEPRRVIALDTNGLGIYASASNYTAKAVLGVSTTGASAGNMFSVVYFGRLDFPDAVFEPQTPLFLGEDGQLTASIPTTKWSKQIATAVSETTVVIGLCEAYYLGD